MAGNRCGERDRHGQQNQVLRRAQYRPDVVEMVDQLHQLGDDVGERHRTGGDEHRAHLPAGQAPTAPVAPHDEDHHGRRQ